jgi:hypothetical protein
LGAGYNPPRSSIAGTFNARFIGVSCTLFDRPAILTRKSKIRAIPAVSGSALEAIAQPPANPLGFTNRAPLAVERGMATLAAKGVVIVRGGRWQFRLTLTAALPPRLGKSSQWSLPNCLFDKKREAAEAAPPS